jgi:ubiquinone/menaquinone biosynthesis C-methylase UbiE/uncharacterized protein YbaR (Trm112 family)
MNPLLLDVLACPRCRGALAWTGEAADEGRLDCGGCGQSYAVSRGVPRMLVGRLEGEELQSQESFSAKWNRQKGYAASGSPTERFQHEWYLKRYGWTSEDELRGFLRPKTRILDAGTGLGRDALWYHALSGHPVVALDISESIDIVRGKVADQPGIHPVQGDVLELPFRDAAFDFVACDQVLSNVADPWRGLARLVGACCPGGHVAFYLYRKKGPIREFADDHIRRSVTRMSPEAAWEFARKLTLLARSLAATGATVEVPEDIDVLELKAGRYDLQRFVFYEVFKAFWNDEFSFDENVLVNYDWYHPAFTFRFTPEEVRARAEGLGLEVLRLDTADRSAISVLARRL